MRKALDELIKAASSPSEFDLTGISYILFEGSSNPIVFYNGDAPASCNILHIAELTIRTANEIAGFNRDTLKDLNWYVRYWKAFVSELKELDLAIDGGDTE